MKTKEVGTIQVPVACRTRRTGRTCRTCYDFPVPPRLMTTPSSPPPPTETDALIERCLAGDQEAWNQIVRQHWRKVFNLAYDGVVTGAVIGTFGAFAGTLAAYKLLNIKVGDKFRRGVIAAMFGMVGISVMALVLSLFGVDLGIFGTGGLGVLFTLAGLVLGIFMLILDFDFVEQGIANQIPERESWTAAFALTVTFRRAFLRLLPSRLPVRIGCTR